MKLNFEENFERVENIANNVAKIYASVSGNSQGFQDAKQEAFLQSVEIELDETKSVNEQDVYLIRKISGMLIDEYRKHNRKRNCEFNLERAASKEKETQDVGFSSAVEAAGKIFNMVVPVNKERTFFSDAEKSLILDYLDEKINALENRQEQGCVKRSPLLVVARRHGITQGRASQILKMFKRRASVLRDVGGNVVFIVDVQKEEPTRDELESAPLFFARD